MVLDVRIRCCLLLLVTILCQTVTVTTAQTWLRSLIDSTNGTIDIKSFPGEQCLRVCDDTQPRICYFSWTMEHYHAMGPACRACSKGSPQDCFHPACLTADGVERGVMSLNRQIPGPMISVCKDDLIVVDITNAMAGTSATIHWHGLHQRATPHMDGVPFITQCPIQFGNTFRYAYLATEAGTQFYHSHSGHHKVNGHYGALIVREPKRADPNSALYDYDSSSHVIVGSDWMHVDGEMFMPGLPSSGGILPVNLLINGRGTFKENENSSRTNVPLEVFYVQRGKRFRFRFINAASHVCPLQLQIEDHTMEIIASDSFHLQPHKVDTLVTTSGERYDFVVHANGVKDTYWVRLRALGSCEQLQLEQFAVLSYKHDPKEKLAFPQEEPPPYDKPFAGARTANHPNATCGQPAFGDYCITDFQAYDTDESIINGEPKHIFTLGFSNFLVSFHHMFETHAYEHFMNIHDELMLQGAINDLSFAYPPFPLLTQPEEIDESMFCTNGTRPARCADRQLCTCIHRLKIELGDLVELYILDRTGMIDDLNHPFHLHGYQMYVMELGQDRRVPVTYEIARELAKRRFTTRNTSQLPPRKDTVSIPSRGYARVRFRADNPGFWLMHCHFEWHTAVGMALVLQVGNTDQMVKPPSNFPKCNSYTPKVDDLLNGHI
ncbi:multicopper oxidase [Anopheles darlingi]|uniref:Multicopper oxidase n=1 Tax=Anopheles darlingi TaxID=43151 RepID=W5JCI5_ANODA|nr:multicopper oxidase [Anopheles darlingi]